MCATQEMGNIQFSSSIITECNTDNRRPNWTRLAEKYQFGFVTKIEQKRNFKICK